MATVTKARNFDKLASLIRAHAAAEVMSNKSERIRIERWIEKLEESDCLNREWQKDRMKYMKLLMNQIIHAKGLSIPFHSMPPDGILPRFPSHISITLKTNTSTPIDPEKVTFWRSIHTKIKSPRSTSNAMAATTTMAKKVQQLEAELRHEKIQQCHQLRQLSAVHSHELFMAADDIIQSNHNSTNNRPFFGSAVSSSHTTTTTMGKSAAAALIAATGIDTALASIQALDIAMDSTNQFGDTLPSQPPKHSLHDNSNNLSTNVSLRTHQPPISSTLHSSSDEEFLLYLKTFQTELECL